MIIKRLKFARAVRSPRDSCWRTPCGVTLIEVMVAMVILTIVALGALGYQYYAATHARIAKSQITAARTAQLLLEDWKSVGAASDYDPTALGLGFSTPDYGEGYFITVDGLPMYISLSYSKVDEDTISKVILRRISVTVRWRRDYRQGAVDTDDPSVVMTTYARIDGP